MGGKPDTVAASAAVLNQTPRVRLLRQLRQWIRSGQLPAGERVPTVAALSARMHVARATVHAALRALEAEGWLEGRGRVRIVAGPTRRRDVTAGAALADTVALLGTASMPVDWDPRQTGWQVFVQIGAAQRLQEHGYNVLHLNLETATPEQLRRLLAAGLRGAVFAPLAGASATPVANLLAELGKAGRPAAICGLPAEWPLWDCVESDQAAGACELTRHLIGRGCRRFLRFWALCPPIPADTPWLRGRDTGVERALTEAGLPVLPPVFPTGVTAMPSDRTAFANAARVYAGFLLEAFRDPARRPDAILLSSDGVGYAVTAACRLLAVEPGRDLLLAGYDNYWEFCPERAFGDFVPAATVDKRNLLIGRELADLCQARLQGTLPQRRQHRLLPPTLIVPGATAASRPDTRQED